MRWNEGGRKSVGLDDMVPRMAISVIEQRQMYKQPYVGLQSYRLCRKDAQNLERRCWLALFTEQFTLDKV